MSQRLDVIIFGATGFTGQRIIPYLKDLGSKEETPVTWGVAARSETKLRDVLKIIESKTGDNYDSIPIIIADVNDEDSLKQMASRAKVIINATGPYRFYGEAVIKACVENGTNYIDVSGEPQFMEMMQLKYHEAALEKNVYLVSACGFDSIPADLGLVFLQKKFQGTLNSVESYLYAEVEGNHDGASGFYTTWESAVYGLAHAHELRSIRGKLYPNKLPDLKPRLRPRGNYFKSETLNKWCIPFIGADRSVMLRTQRFFYEKNNQRPAQVQAYIGFKSLYIFLLFLFYGLIFKLFCKFAFTRNLLLKNPKLFSNGLFDKNGPPDEKQKDTSFYILFVCEGWSETQSNPTDQFTTKPNKKVIGKVSGRNPGYGLTCAAAALSALTILKESDKMPETGGCYPPGAAFAQTSLIEKLNENGLKFEVVSESTS
ncbi:saccharopine dehydrogenase-like oxidoreductase [Onthophagus taurus]|uniref:saccharopine dehydrogenase-like oxidoreductase n=1 Tax=Onthophagus taurus TaxID=166361 RepID=UPI0039BDE66F